MSYNPIHLEITTANHRALFNSVSKNQNQGNHNFQSDKKVTMIISEWELRVETANFLKARENTSNQVVFGFSFTFDWLRLWREFSGLITQRSKAKPKQYNITFDTQLETALTKGI